MNGSRFQTILTGRIFRLFPFAFLLAAIIIAGNKPLAVSGAASGSDQEAPGFSEPRLPERARKALAEGRENDALSALLQFLSTHPDNKGALRVTGDILRRQGKDSDALAIYLRLLRLEPGDGNVLLQTGLIRQRLGQLYEAQATLVRALENKAVNGDDAALAQKSLDEIYDNWDVLRVMQERKDNPAQERFHTYQINKASDKAVVSYALRGFARHSLHKPEEALQDFNTALSMGGMDQNLKDAVLRSKAGIEKERSSELDWTRIHQTVRSFQEKGDSQGLEAYYSTLLENESSRVYAAVGRASMRVSRGDYDGAESDFRYALESNPDGKAREDTESGLRMVARLRHEQAQKEGGSAVAKGESGSGSMQTEKAPGTALESPPAPPYIDPYRYFEEAEKLLQKGNADGIEAVLVKLRRLPLKGEEKGSLLYYSAERDWLTGEKERAFQEYERALPLVKEKYRKSAVLARMAEFSAVNNDKTRAADYAERSALQLPHEPWKMMQVAGIFSGMGMADKAVEYYEAALHMHPDARTEANAYSGLAEIYKTQQDIKKYKLYAQQYIAATAKNNAAFSDEEKGLAAFYQAELFAAQGDKAKAFQSLERASLLLKEKYRLSEIYSKMAEYQTEHGNPELADSYAESSARLLPDQIWRLQDAIGIFKKTGNVEQAEVYTRKAIALDPVSNGVLYQDLANLHLGMGDRDSFLLNNAAYIDALMQQMETKGGKPAREELMRLHNARKRQKEVSRTWGFASYSYYSRTDEGDYFYGMTNELYREFRFGSGQYGKIYGQYAGTVTSYYSGDYLDKTTLERNQWESRQHWHDSAYGVVGIQFHPFPFPWLYDLSFDAEYVFPLHDGRHKDDDFRFRASYGWTDGDEPMPFGNLWDYKKFNVSATYSYRDGDVTSKYSFEGGDVTSGGDFRYGKTLVTDYDRNFLVIPHLRADWSYEGKKREEGERWNLGAGPGIIFKKWFNEDKYHTPTSNIEVHLYYNWGLSNGHENKFGINTGISF